MDEWTFKARSSRVVVYGLAILIAVWVVLLVVAALEGTIATLVLGILQIGWLSILFLTQMSPMQLALTDDGLSLRIAFRTLHIPYREIVKVHSELFGSTYISVYRNGKIIRHIFKARAEDVGRLREALRRRAPEVKVTGLPTETIVASARH